MPRLKRPSCFSPESVELIRSLGDAGIAPKKQLQHLGIRSYDTFIEKLKNSGFEIKMTWKVVPIGASAAASQPAPEGTS